MLKATALNMYHYFCILDGARSMGSSGFSPYNNADGLCYYLTSSLDHAQYQHSPRDNRHTQNTTQGRDDSHPVSCHDAVAYMPVDGPTDKTSKIYFCSYEYWFMTTCPRVETCLLVTSCR